MELETIGERIKRKREKLGITRKQLGTMLNVTDDAVRLWEIGKNDIDSARCVRLAKVLKTSCDWLLTGEGTQNIGIINQTGLSNDAINILNGCKRDADETMQLIPECINFLLECGSPDIFLLITHYLIGMTTDTLYRKTQTGDFVEINSLLDKEAQQEYLLFQLIFELNRIKGELKK